MASLTFLGIFSWISSTVGSLLSVVWLVVVIYSLYRLWTSSSSDGAKIVWTLVILLFPILGTILWLLLGNSSRR